MPHQKNTSPEQKTGFLHHHLVDEITLFLLLGLSFAGVAITNISPERSQLYWLSMVPVFFVASLITEWHHVRSGKYPWKSVIWNHSLQWLALLVAVKMVFLIQTLGRLNNETTGLMLLLTLALSTFDAGIRMGWLYRLTGIFLAAGLLILVYIERYLWVLAIIAILLLILHHFMVKKA
ncbi:MAG TPA: hypothetical protein ENJ84_02050 [Gammaproteobacteria bacterium]|nr:hypothetical protein [Gammaproteobacteria bacterium]